MTIWNLNPFEEMQRMHDEMDGLIQNIGIKERPILEHKNGNSLNQLQAFRMPVTDVYDTEKSVILQFELPGVDKKDINLEISDDGVSVKVEKKAEVEQDHKDFYRYESKSHCFYRKLALPDGVDPSKAEASYKDGILKVEIPKTEKAIAKSRRLEIK